MTMTIEQVYDGARRDTKAVREDLVNLDEKLSRQTLAAHTRTLAVIAENESRAKKHRADLHGELAELRAGQKVMLVHLERLVVVPAERETLSPPTWQGRLATWLASPASTRAVLALAAAGVLATLSGCVALMGVH